MNSKPYTEAFLTDDSTAILRFAADAVAAGMPAALITLVEIRGGAARPLGSQMAVRADGRYCGFVSGGCVEAAVAAEALEAIAAGEDRQVRYGQGSPYFDIVLPCGGGITLAIHVLRSSQALLSVLAALDARKPAGLHYTPGSNALDYVAQGDVPQGLATGWNGSSFEIGYRPHTRLVIFGRSIEVEATTKLAQAVGYDVHVSDTCDSDTASRLIDEDSAVALLFHDPDRELPALQAALAATPFYIGALGSRRTHQRRVEALIDLGYGNRDIARIKAPIGVFKAGDAHSLALSVLADIAAARTATVPLSGAVGHRCLPRGGSPSSS